MKKKLFIVLLISIITGIFIINNVYNNSYSSKIIIVNSTADNTISTANTLSMMLETKAASGVYEVSSDTSWPTSGYTFNDSLSKCNKGSSLTWDSDNAAIVFSGTTADTCYVYFDLIPTIADVCDTGNNLPECIQELYTVSGEGTVGLYYFDEVGDYTNANQEYADYRYIYSGDTDDVNNFLCLGDDCTNTVNLYRILGIYLNDDNEYEVKVMKYEYSDTTLAIDSTDGWDSTSLYTWLNSTFLDTIEDYDDLITTHTWKIPTNYGGNYTALQHVSYVNDATTTVDAKIALIYDSDFGYSSDFSYWSKNLSDYEVDCNTSWMVGDYSEWTLSYWKGTYCYSSRINNGAIYPGTAFYYFQNTMNMVATYYARPTFYLSSSVQYSSGSGTIDNPIILVTE